MRILTTTLALLVIMAVSTMAQITSSSHDFSSSTWNTSGQICITCHAPHNAAQKTTGPLWNHAVSTASFTMYDNTSTGANKTTGTQNSTPPTTLSAASKVCMSCHDGTVGLGSFGSTTNATNYLTGQSLLGTALDDDHPIGITYDANLISADGGLRALSYSVTFGNSSTGTIGGHMLYNGKVECASCHDVHNKHGQTSLLVKSNAASALCLTCHIK